MNTLAALAALIAAAAAPEAIDAEELAACLVEHHDVATEKTFKRFFIAALEEDKAAAQERALEVGMKTASVAMTSCGLTMAQLEDPAFGLAAGIYGEWIGEKVFTEAFERMGI